MCAIVCSDRAVFAKRRRKRPSEILADKNAICDRGRLLHHALAREKTLHGGRADARTGRVLVN